MNDFPSNSRMAAKETEPRERIQAVTTAETVRRKRGLGRQFKETFFIGSGREAIGFMVEQVVVPTIRDMFADALRGGIDQLIYGDRSAKRLSRPTNGYQPNVPYHAISTPTRAAQPQQRVLSRQSRARHQFDDLVIPTRRDAEEVLDRMYDLMSQYGAVTVADLYELTGIQSEHTDMKWGWSNLRGAKAIQSRRHNGFILDLPQPEELT